MARPTRSGQDKNRPRRVEGDDLAAVVALLRADDPEDADDPELV